MFRKSLKYLSILFVLVSIYFFCETRTDGFRTYKIVFDVEGLEKNNKKISRKKKEEIEKILSQDFLYLGRGRQSFAFESKDQKYVLKFLNHRNFYYPKFLENIPIGLLQNSINRKRKRLPETFKSIYIAYNLLEEQTAVIYANLVKKEKFSNVNIVNKYGKKVYLDIDKTYFVLQKKMTPIFKKLKKSCNLRKDIDSFFDLIQSRIKKYIADEDLNVEDNYGFIEDEAFILDVGKLYLDRSLKDKKRLKKELYYSTKYLRRWLVENSPDLVFYLDEKIENILKDK